MTLMRDFEREMGLPPSGVATFAAPVVDVIPHRHRHFRTPKLPPAADLLPPEIPAASEPPRAARLRSLADKAMNVLEEHMDMVPDDFRYDDRMFGKVLATRNAAATTVLNTQVRVDETALKHRDTDRLASLLERMEQAQRVGDDQPA